MKTVKARFIAVAVLGHLAILLAGLWLLLSLRNESRVESDMRGGSNRISMSMSVAAATSNALTQLHAAAENLAKGSDPQPALRGVRQELDGALNQLQFLPDGEGDQASTLRTLLNEGAGPIKALLGEPVTPEKLAVLLVQVGELDRQTERAVATLVQQANERNLQTSFSAIAHFRTNQRDFLVMLSGLLLLNLFGTVYVYRRMVTPLSAVSGSLNAVSAGRLPSRPLPDTGDEFGEIVRAIHKIRAQAEHIRQLAFEDPGTGLPSRNALDAELREVRRQRPIDGTHGLILISVDTYDNLRSGFGLRVAERVMRMAATRLQALDHLPQMLFRLDALTIGVLVDRGVSEAVARADIKRITAEAFSRLNHPVEVEDHRYRLSLSAGAAIFPDDARDAEEYINVAFEALRNARAEGSGHLRFGERGLTHRLRKHLALAEQIGMGLRQGQFVPYFQPVVDAERGKVVGAEVLVRWRQPDGRLIMPGEFMRIAESSDTIREMTRTVLTQACTVIQNWADNGYTVAVSFNVSAAMLSPELLVICREALASSGLPAGQLIAEITETALINNLESATEVIEALRATGIRISLDDFGTGYSSLSHLLRFPIDGIKIDPVITRASATQSRAADIVRAIAQIAERGGLYLVAEGAETEDDMCRLRDLGCAIQQGYHYSRAMPEEQFIAWVRHFESQAAAA
ncbi:MAG: EAL domain-containing protein [Pseudomonadota bacterium]|nr:EAL domain-containing protein [Pseudomonadota bacterium]